MLTEKQIGILHRIINHCERVEEKVCTINRTDFDNNLDIKEIVCFNVFQIGELVKKLEPNFLSRYNAIPWKNVKGMRDWVAHGYGTISWNDVWNTSTQDIGPLKEYCTQILNTNK